MKTVAPFRANLLAGSIYTTPGDGSTLTYGNVCVDGGFDQSYSDTVDVEGQLIGGGIRRGQLNTL